jgi:hypothetical protein
VTTQNAFPLLSFINFVQQQSVVVFSVQLFYFLKQSLFCSYWCYYRISLILLFEYALLVDRNLNIGLQSCWNHSVVWKFFNGFFRIIHTSSCDVQMELILLLFQSVYFCFFSYLIALGMISNTILVINGKSSYCWLGPDFKWKAFDFLLHMVLYGFAQCPLLGWGTCFPFPICWTCSFVRLLDSVKHFFWILWDDHQFLLLFCYLLCGDYMVGF